MTVQELIDKLQAYEDKSQTIAASLWHVDDVKGLDSGSDLTDAQAARVLEEAERYHDSNAGINWEVLQVHIDNVVREGEGNA